MGLLYVMKWAAHFPQPPPVSVSLIVICSSQVYSRCRGRVFACFLFFPSLLMSHVSLFSWHFCCLRNVDADTWKCIGRSYGFEIRFGIGGCFLLFRNVLIL